MKKIDVTSSKAADTHRRTGASGANMHRSHDHPEDCRTSTRRAVGAGKPAPRKLRLPAYVMHA